MEYKKTLLADGNNLTIKLLISGLGNPVNPLVNVAAQVMSEYGATHAGIQIGPFILDWTTSEVIVPRPIRIKQPICVLDVQSKVQISESSLRKLARLVVCWNLTMHYNNMGFSTKSMFSSKSANCHCFAKALMQYMDIAPFWTKNGVISKYLRHVKRSNVHAKMVCQSTEFKSHEELDKHVIANWNALKKGDEEGMYIVEYSILQSVPITQIV